MQYNNVIFNQRVQTEMIPIPIFLVAQFSVYRYTVMLSLEAVSCLEAVFRCIDLGLGLRGHCRGLVLVLEV